MRSLQEWRLQADRTYLTEFKNHVLCYIESVLRPSPKSLCEWQETQLIQESVESSRYSVEVNFRTKADEVLEAYAKIVLGYVSAALKERGYHTKHVFTERPIRILVASRNWDDGEWCCVVSYNPQHKCFVLTKGFYAKQHLSVNVHSNHSCSGDSAADITKDVVNTMHDLKKVPDRYQEKLKPVPLKRGPKR